MALTLFEVPPEGMLFVNNQNDYFDRINSNLQFGFYPKEFKIRRKPHHFKKENYTCRLQGICKPI